MSDVCYIYKAFCALACSVPEDYWWYIYTTIYTIGRTLPSAITDRRIA